MNAIDSITLQVDDVSAAEQFYAAFGVGDRVSVAPADAPTDGFRSYTLSVVVSQPGNADRFLTAAIDAGARAVKPATKSFWGYGGVVQAPDGAIWKVATSKKKDSADASQSYDEIVLLIGAADLKASKRFYTEQGLEVDKSYPGYTQFKGDDTGLKLALYGHKNLAKDAGVPPEGSGSHRLVVHRDGASFTDPDGFNWQPTAG